MPNTELGHVFLSNGVEAERYASEAVRITKDLKWKDWGERLNLYLTTMESLLWPDLIVLERWRQRETAQVLADDHDQGAGCGRQLPESGGHRPVPPCSLRESLNRKK